MQANVRDYQEIKLKGETVGTLSKRTLAYDTGFTLPPGTYTLKFLTRENETGKMGTFETKFVVPDLTTQLKYLPISSVVLSNQRQDLNTALATAEKDKKLLAAEPAGAGQPEAGPQRDPRLQEGPGHVRVPAGLPARRRRPRSRWWPRVSFYRGKVKAFETAPLQITEGLDAKTKALPIRFSVPLGKAAARPLHLPGQRAGSAGPEVRLLARPHRHGAVGQASWPVHLTGPESATQNQTAPA